MLGAPADRTGAPADRHGAMAATPSEAVGAAAGVLGGLAQFDVPIWQSTSRFNGGASVES